MPEFIYTQDDVNQLKQEWESDLFEQKTNDTLLMVIKRLDESNGYKSTIGKDTKETKEEVKKLKERFDAFEQGREKELKSKQEREDKQHQWYQDRFVRMGILAAIVWEAWSMFGEPVKQVIHIWIAGQ